MKKVCCLFAGSGQSLHNLWERWPNEATLSFHLRSAGLHPTPDELQTLHAGFRVRLSGTQYRLEWFNVSAP